MIKDKLRKAIELREKGDLKRSRAIFNLLIDKVKHFEKSSSKKEKRLYQAVMGEYVIQLRHEASRLLENALKIAEKIYGSSKEKARTPFVIKLDKANKEIGEALNSIEKDMNHPNKLGIIAWKSYALMVRALIVSSCGRSDEAVNCAAEALLMAKNNKLKIRTKQARSLLEFVKSKR
jgi:tetratricopeptide (TPR) repeat protein